MNKRVKKKKKGCKKQGEEEEGEGEETKKMEEEEVGMRRNVEETERLLGGYMVMISMAALIFFCWFLLFLSLAEKNDLIFRQVNM